MTGKGTADYEPDRVIVAAVEPASDNNIDGIAVALIDATGERVHLYLDVKMCEQLCEQIASALERKFGQ